MLAQVCLATSDTRGGSYYCRQQIQHSKSSNSASAGSITMSKLQAQLWENMPVTRWGRGELICMELCMHTSSFLLAEQHDYMHFARYNFLIDSFWDIYKIQMYKSMYKYNPCRNITEILFFKYTTQNSYNELTHELILSLSK